MGGEGRREATTRNSQQIRCAWRPHCPPPCGATAQGGGRGAAKSVALRGRDGGYSPASAFALLPLLCDVCTGVVAKRPPKSPAVRYSAANRQSHRTYPPPRHLPYPFPNDERERRRSTGTGRLPATATRFCASGGAVRHGRAGRGRCGATVPRHLHNHILRILRAAESAARRLIVIAARDVVVVVVRPANKPPHHPPQQPQAHPSPPSRAFPCSIRASASIPPAPAPREILPAHLRHRRFGTAPDPRNPEPHARRRDRRRAPAPPARRAETRAGRSSRTGQTPRPLARQTRSRIEPQQIFLADAPRLAARPPQAAVSRGRRCRSRECHVAGAVAGTASDSAAKTRPDLPSVNHSN